METVPSRKRRSPLTTTIVGVLVALPFVLAAAHFGLGLPAHGAETAEEDTALPWHRYDVPITMASTFAQQFAVRKLGWTVAASTPGRSVELDARGHWGLTHDHLIVTCWPVDSKYVLVGIKAYGTGNVVGDIRALQAGMDDKLPAAP